jgi:hypothetical protein
MIVNKKNVYIASTCDGTHLKFTFRRSVNQQLMNKWYDMVSVAESLQFSGEDDAIIWKYERKGVHSVSSLYSITNYRDATPIYIPAVSEIKVPPRLHVFLWLLANNKLFTRDNLSKRQHLDDGPCVFCAEN